MTATSRAGSRLAVDVHDVVVLEAAHDVRDRVDLADVAQELVPEPLALAGAADEPGDVEELDRRRRDLLGPGDRREPREARVRHGHDAHVGLDRAERIVRRLRVLRGGDCIEDRRLPDVREADDAASKTHAPPRLIARPGTVGYAPRRARRAGVHPSTAK